MRQQSLGKEDSKFLEKQRSICKFRTERMIMAAKHFKNVMSYVTETASRETY